MEPTFQAELDRLQEALAPFFEDRKTPRVLEAGCGSRTYIRLPEDAYIVGVDISEDQLRKNTGLHEKRVGDIQACDLGESGFDAIICWDVLEHLDRPRDALLNFFRAVSPGGLIILGFPNAMSIKGLVTKFTPHFFHILVYRYLWRQKTVGKKGYYSPFPTYMRFAMSPGAVQDFASAHGFSTTYFRLYQGQMQTQMRRRSRVVDWMLRIADPCLAVLTLGRLHASRSDAILVLKKDASDRTSRAP